MFVVIVELPNAKEASKWLSIHFPCLKHITIERTGTKQSIPSYVLIDDLDMNMVEFVESDPNRRGILFVHPWSIDMTQISKITQIKYIIALSGKLS